MSKLKNEAELVKEAVRVGMIYAEIRGAAKFDPTESAQDKIAYVYRLLAHDKLIQPLAKAQLDLPHMKHKLAMWISKQLPEGHALLK
jgi:hypothetical protein